ncbi:MAG: DEAD/DEAH box helicase [Prevotella sp.]
MKITAEQLKARMGVEKLTPMQTETGNAMQSGEAHIVVLSPTGSGKTLAYLLPIVQSMDAGLQEVQAVVVLPTRELAIQSQQVLAALDKQVRALCCYGGRPAMDEHREMMKKKPQVIFGTPGRLNDHIAKGNFSVYHVRKLIIDEYDKCLEMGFREELATLVRSLPGVRQKVLLSATDSQEIPFLFAGKPYLTIDYSPSEEKDERIRIYELRSEVKDKLELLGKLLCTFGNESCIVFLNYRESVARVSSYLENEGFLVVSYHGGMAQEEREQAFAAFRNCSASVLVATDIASRGIDIPEVRYVVHYHLPQNEVAYTHRVGRTARWERTGESFFVLGPDEHIPDFVQTEATPYTLPESIPAPAAPKMATLYIGKGKLDKISKGDIVGFLCKIGGLNSGDIGTIEIKERYTHVAVSYKKHKSVIMAANGEKIKNRKTVVEIVK